MGVEIKENEMFVLLWFLKIQDDIRSILSSKIRRFLCIASKKQCIAR